MSRRFGVNPPTSLVTLREGAGRELLSAFGLSPVIINDTAPGQSLREAWRVFTSITLAAIGRLVASQLGPALGVPDLAFDFAAAHSADIATRSRAYRSLRDAGGDGGTGMSDQDARGLVGFATLE